MKKEQISWGFSWLSGSTTNYELLGTVLDKELFEAVMDFNQEKIVKLVKEGANPNVQITKTVIHSDGKKDVTYGHALAFLVSTQPQKFIDATSPGYNYESQIARLRSSIEREKSRGRNRNDSYIRSLDSEIRQLKRQKLAETSKISKANEETEQKIISTVELLLSMGYGPTRNGGMVALNDDFIKNLKFKKLATYLAKARFVEEAITKIMNDNRMFVDEESEIFSINKQTEYRNLDVQKAEMIEIMRNDSELNPQTITL